MENKIKAFYGSFTQEFPQGTDVDRIREVMEVLYPEIANATEDVGADGNVTFTLKSGEKGNI